MPVRSTRVQWPAGAAHTDTAEAVGRVCLPFSGHFPAVVVLERDSPHPVIQKTLVEKLLSVSHSLSGEAKKMTNRDTVPVLQKLTAWPRGLTRNSCTTQRGPCLSPE